MAGPERSKPTTKQPAKRPPSTPKSAESSDFVRLPAFADPHGRMLVACADFADDGVGPQVHQQFLKERSMLVAPIGTDGGMIEIWGSSLKSNHLHIQVFRAGLTGRLPKVNATTEEAQSLLRSVAGKGLSVTGTGRFESPVDALPERGLVRTAIDTMRIQVGTMAVNQTGAKFMVSGGPLSGIGWTYLPEHKIVRTEIEIEHKTAMGPTYLTSLYDEALEVYGRWILTEIPGATK